MPAPLLITRPEYEVPTRYLARWSEPIIKEAVDKGVTVIDLARRDANQARVVGTLEKKQSEKMLVVLNGHGNEDAVMGQDGEVLVTTDTVGCLRNKVVYARACSSAQRLGPRAVEKGVRAYIGYDIEFSIYMDADKVEHPLEDPIAALFLEPSNQVPLCLLKGHPAGEANRRSRKKFRDNIRRIILEGPRSSHYYTIPVLYADMMHQVCLGDQQAKIY